MKIIMSFRNGAPAFYCQEGICSHVSESSDAAIRHYTRSHILDGEEFIDGCGWAYLFRDEESARTFIRQEFSYHHLVWEGKGWYCKSRSITDITFVRLPHVLKDLVDEIARAEKHLKTMEQFIKEHP